MLATGEARGCALYESKAPTGRQMVCLPPRRGSNYICRRYHGLRPWLASHAPSEQGEPRYGIEMRLNFSASMKVVSSPPAVLMPIQAKVCVPPVVKEKLLVVRVEGVVLVLL